MTPDVEGARVAARMILSMVKLASESGRGPAAFRSDEIFRAIHSRFEPMAAVALVEAAEDGYPIAIEAVHQAIAWFIKEGEPVPEILRNYLLELLLLQNPGRKRKRGRHHENYLRDSLIKLAVKAAMGYGLHPTRNEATDAPSACSVVAEVLAENGAKMREGNVARVAGRFQK
jgi:hypothetical protein